MESLTRYQRFVPSSSEPTDGGASADGTNPEILRRKDSEPLFWLLLLLEVVLVLRLAGWLVATISFYFHLNFLFLLLVIYFAFPYERFLFAREREISNRRQDGELHVGAGVHVCFVGREEGGNEKGFK